MDNVNVEVSPRSSAGQFQEYLESTVWDDMFRELCVWLESVRDGLESPGTSDNELLRNQGRAEACRYFMSLPEVMRDVLIEDQGKEESDVK